MTQRSFPKENEPVGFDRWGVWSLGLPDGVYDDGGPPYDVTSFDSLTDTVTISPGANGVARARVDGFIHEMDAPEKVSIPPVTKRTEFQIGLLYDPARHNTDLPVVYLTSWVKPGTFTKGEIPLPLGSLVREANQTLSAAGASWKRQMIRVARTSWVDSVDALPTHSRVYSGDTCFVWSTGETWVATARKGVAPSWRRLSGTTTVPFNSLSGWSSSRTPTGGMIVTWSAEGRKYVTANLALDRTGATISLARGEWRYLSDAPLIPAGFRPKDPIYVLSAFYGEHLEVGLMPDGRIRANPMKAAVTMSSGRGFQVQMSWVAS